MIKNVLPSLRQRSGPQRICSRQKSIRSGTACDSFSQTPHMRGKDCNGKGTGAAPGITPAYAGKSARCICACTWDRDHPRVCGEKKQQQSRACRPGGSPPRMRGKACRGRLFALPKGITPAYAGKRKSCVAQKTSAWDHPRMCGEKNLAGSSRQRRTGSPPHVRGKVAHKFFPVFPQEDHSRMCGEKFQVLFRMGSVIGSPPHVRGKGARCRLRTNFDGITPACAGKSEELELGYTYPSDHPRMCGEKKELTREYTR